MTIRLSNWGISAATAASCYVLVVIVLHSNVDAFAGYSQPRFMSSSSSPPVSSVSSQQQSSPVSTIAFLGSKPSSTNHNNFCLFSTSDDDDDDDDDTSNNAVEESEDTNETEEVDYDEDDDVDDEEEEEEHTPLQDDPDDPNYTAQKALIETSIQNRKTLAAVKELTFGEGSNERLQTNIGEFLDEQLAEAGVDSKLIDELMGNMEVSEEEASAAIEGENEKMQEAYDAATGEGERVGIPYDRREAFLRNMGSGPDVFPADDDPLMMSSDDEDTEGGSSDSSILNDDLVKLQSALEDLVGTTRGFADGSTIQNKQAMIDPDRELALLDEQTLDEIELCLNASATDANDLEYKESIKNEDPIRWILYDRNFNVTNLMLASCKYNPGAPLLLNHWMPQLCVFSKYADAREREFVWTWDDCADIEMDELARYYKGLGYDEIPTFSPKDTNVVEIETKYDDEMITMAAFEHWMDEVYNPEDEDLYFDDDAFQPENNVYDFNYGMEDTDEVKAFEIELDEFKMEHTNETQEWRDNFAKEKNYTVIVDEEAVKDFRGYLVVACCGSDSDVELAERITARMGEAHGKQVHVETRVYSHARESDNVYEIWLESYDITLLHSKRGANYNAKAWDGPADVDEKQMVYLVDKVGHLIGDDSRYSYHLHEFVTEV